MGWGEKMDKKRSLLGPFAFQITAEEIRNKRFRGSVMGYSAREVDDFIRSLAGVWDKHLQKERELTTEVKNLKAQLEDQKAQVRELLISKERTEQEAIAIRDQAKKEAAELSKEVEEKAVLIRQRTENWLEEVIAGVEETERQKNNFVTAFRSALDSHYELLKKEMENTEPLGAKLSTLLHAPNEKAQSEGGYQ
jgi:DivIVA domain-containing protein